MRQVTQWMLFCLGAWVVAVLATSPAYAQCAFSHGQNTGNNGWSRMVQAYVPCGAPDCDGFGPLPPNNSTAGGIPSCSPPQTYHQLAGAPANGWVFDVLTGRARLKLDQLSGPTDVRIRLQLRNVRDGTGVFPVVGATGSLQLTTRLTFNDPVNGDMTQVDMPVSTPVVISTATGDANVLTTFNALLAALTLPPLPTCSNFEVIDAAVIDPAANKFLRLGHFRM